jgi:hypothetical protein
MTLVEKVEKSLEFMMISDSTDKYFITEELIDESILNDVDYPIIKDCVDSMLDYVNNYKGDKNIILDMEVEDILKTLNKI